MRALLMRAVPFLPCEHVLVACSTSFFASQHFWGMGEHFAEHPILGQKSNYLFRSLLWLISLQSSQRLAIIGQLLILILLLCIGKEQMLKTFKKKYLLFLLLPKIQLSSCHAVSLFVC